MANSQVQQNLIPSEPQLQDLLNLLRKDINLNLNCHHIGTIKTFYPTTQRADATINYKRTYFEKNAQGNYVPHLVDYPIALDCPVICLGGGGFALTFPIAAGDECLILFNDRDMDNWLQGSTTSGVATPRLHSFSDGIILVGLRSTLKVIASYSTNELVLRNATGTIKAGIDASTAFIKTLNTEVTAKEAKVKIANNDLELTLNSVLQDLSSQLQDLTTELTTLSTAISVLTVTTVDGPSGPPINAADFVTAATNITTIGTQIGTIATQIGSFLE